MQRRSLCQDFLLLLPLQKWSRPTLVRALLHQRATNTSKCNSNVATHTSTSMNHTLAGDTLKCGHTLGAGGTLGCGKGAVLVVGQAAEGRICTQWKARGVGGKPAGSLQTILCWPKVRVGKAKNLEGNTYILPSNEKKVDWKSLRPNMFCLFRLLIIGIMFSVA